MNRILFSLDIGFEEIVVYESFKGVLFRGCGDVGQVGDWDEGQGNIEAFLYRLSAACLCHCSGAAYSKTLTTMSDSCVSMQGTLPMSMSMIVADALRGIPSGGSSLQRLPQGVSYSSDSSRRGSHACVFMGCSKPRKRSCSSRP